MPYHIPLCRAPRGARGLKLAVVYNVPVNGRSRAPRGARGLKCRTAAKSKKINSRAPRGARGLKLFVVLVKVMNVRSRPSRGAWIEMPKTKALSG